MTRGQFGSASDSVRSTSEYRSFIAGGEWKPWSKLSLSAQVAYTRGSESMDQIVFSVPEEVLARLIDSNYDLTEAHTYSNLDSKRWDVNFTALTRISRGLEGLLSYSYVDFNDVTPYLADLSGKLNAVQVALRWTL